MAEASGSQRGGTRRRLRGRQWLFALVPALGLLLVAEGAARLAVIARPSLRSLPLGPETAGLFRPDRDLFWSLRPDLDLPFLGERVVTNDLGLRSPPVRARQPGELRILSLGESTTFGSGVAGDETYTARLPLELAARGFPRPVTAINAGVPAYSSFQSLRYLEGRGLALEPDLVVVYHEVNDYLPSSVRDSSQNEVGVLQTDWQRWDSQHRGLAAWLGSSELVRFLRLRVARARIARFDPGGFANPVADIGLPRIGIPPRLVRVDGEKPRRAGIDEKGLVPRVAPAERRRIFERFAALTRERGVGLLVVHPSYRDSIAHECLLTGLLRERGIDWVDAHLALHPEGVERGGLFRDSWHPVARGHARLARTLADAIDHRYR